MRADVGTLGWFFRDFTAGHIACAQAVENFVGTGVEILRNEVLYFFHPSHFQVFAHIQQILDMFLFELQKFYLLLQRFCQIIIQYLPSPWEFCISVHPHIWRRCSQRIQQGSRCCRQTYPSGRGLPVRA